MDYSAITSEGDADFAVRLIKEHGVAAIPISPFLQPGEPAGPVLRFCFAKRDETLERAAERLHRVLGVGSGAALRRRDSGRRRRPMPARQSAAAARPRAVLRGGPGQPGTCPDRAARVRLQGAAHRAAPQPLRALGHGRHGGLRGTRRFPTAVPNAGCSNATASRCRMRPSTGARREGRRESRRTAVEDAVGVLRFTIHGPGNGGRPARDCRALRAQAGCLGRDARGQSGHAALRARSTWTRRRKKSCARKPPR